MTKRAGAPGKSAGATSHTSSVRFSGKTFCHLAVKPRTEHRSRHDDSTLPSDRSYLARTPSCLVRQISKTAWTNFRKPIFPGTVDTHPNWTRKMQFVWMKMSGDERLRQLGAALRSTRPLG